MSQPSMLLASSLCIGDAAGGEHRHDIFVPKHGVHDPLRHIVHVTRSRLNTGIEYLVACVASFTQQCLETQLGDCAYLGEARSVNPS